MNRKQSETENLTYTSIDNLLNEVREVAFEGVKRDVPATYIADYIEAESKTIVNSLRTGIMKDFDAIYREFIDEVVENGRYDEWLSFLKFREGLSDVRMP